MWPNFSLSVVKRSKNFSIMVKKHRNFFLPYSYVIERRTARCHLQIKCTRKNSFFFFMNLTLACFDDYSTGLRGWKWCLTQFSTQYSNADYLMLQKLHKQNAVNTKMGVCESGWKNFKLGTYSKFSKWKQANNQFSQ